MQALVAMAAAKVANVTPSANAKATPHAAHALTVLGSPELTLEQANYQVRKCRDRLIALERCVGWRVDAVKAVVTWTLTLLCPLYRHSRGDQVHR